MDTETVELKVAVDQPAKWARRLTITVPAQRIDREREQVTQRLAKRLHLPGFRKGKVPAQVVEKRFGPAIEQELIERVVQDAYKQAVEQEGLTPISQAEVESVDYQPGTDLTFHVGFEVRPELELNRLGGFTVQRDAARIGPDEVDRVIERLRQEQATWETVEDETPTAGDMVAVEITATDESGEAAQPRPYRFVLGEGQVVADIEDAIRTLKAGEKGDFTLQVPATEDTEPRQRPLHIRLKEVKRPKLPELTDDFARAVGEFDSLEVLRARVREDLEREATTESERAVRQRLIDAIVEANPIELPETMVEHYLERVLPERDGTDGERLAEARQLARPAAEAAIRRLLVIERVAQMEGLRASESDIDQRVEQLAHSWERPVGEVWAQLQKSGRLQMLEEEITEDKVFGYLKAQSTIAEG